MNIRMKFAFQYSAPSVWKSLPSLFTNSESVTTFKSRLKTYLFSLVFDCSVHIWHQPTSASPCEVTTILVSINEYGAKHGCHFFWKRGQRQGNTKMVGKSLGKSRKLEWKLWDSSFLGKMCTLAAIINAVIFFLLGENHSSQASSHYHSYAVHPVWRACFLACRSRCMELIARKHIRAEPDVHVFRKLLLTYSDILIFSMWLLKCAHVQHVIGALQMHWMMMIIIMINSPVILKRKRLWIASDDRCSNSVLFVHAFLIWNIACALQDSYAGHAGSDAGGALRELSPSEVGLWRIGWEIVRFQSQVKNTALYHKMEQCFYTLCTPV